ncbi:MAG: aldo/keto reductase [Treponema sp.]|nr:aldo/keto reductase [Treponema sp.]
MEYVRLGKTNLLVSRIGFGTSLLKDFADSNDVSTIVHTAYDGGINFFNSTRNKNISEKLLGDALHDLRQDIIISSTTSAKTKEELNSDVHESLMNMHVDQIDLYQYEINSFVPLKDGIDGIYNELLKMKDSGKINHIGAMTEDFDLAKKIINTNLYETLQFPFSMISSLECTELITLCEKHDMGFIAMQPLCGGILSDIPLAFGFLHQYENVVPLWGIQTAEELTQILYFNEHPPIVDDTFKTDVEKTRLFFN